MNRSGRAGEVLNVGVDKTEERMLVMFLHNELFVCITAFKNMDKNWISTIHPG